MNNWRTPIRLRLITQATLAEIIGCIGVGMFVRVTKIQLSVAFAILALTCIIAVLTLIESRIQESRINELLRHHEFHWVYISDELSGFIHQFPNPSLLNRQLGLVIAIVLGVIYVLIGLQVSTVFIAGAGLFVLLSILWYIPPTHSGNVLLPSPKASLDVYMDQNSIYQTNAARSYKLPNTRKASAEVAPGNPSILHIHQRLQGTSGTILEWQIAIPAGHEAEAQQIAERYQTKSGSA